MAHKLTLVIPCYNEEQTLEACVDKVREIGSSELELELIIINDASADNSLQIAQSLAEKYPEITVLNHQKNQHWI